MQKLKVPRYVQWLIINAFIFLIIMSLLRMALVFAFKTNVSFSALGPSFLLGLRYDIRIVSIVCLIIFLIGSIKFLHPFQTKTGSTIAFSIWIIFCTLLSVFYAVDFAHYAYLSQRLNGSIINYFDDAQISMSMVWQTYPVIRIIIGLIVGVVLLVGIVRLTYNYILSKPIITKKYQRIIWGVAFFLVLAVGIFGRVGQFPLRWSDAFSLGSDYKAQVSLNPFQSFFSSLSYRHASYDLKKVRQYYPFMSSYLGVTKPDSNTLSFERIVNADPTAQTLKPNIVLVICESFSAYKSSMINNPLNTTPFFNSMVKDGIYFDRCFSPAYGTARGVWATVTGVPDVQLFKTASRNPAAVDQHTIINDFKEYEKYYFLGGSTSWANIRGLLTNNIKGLHLYEEGDYKAAKIDVWGISDKNLFLEANKVLAKQTSPFFAVIQTADNHRPYTIPQEDLSAFKKVNVPVDTLKKYGFSTVDEYNAFRYTDFGFHQFMNAAKNEQYFQNTIFVFVGDHGITGDAGNMLPKIFTEQRLTSEHVPLLFYAPSLLKPARYSLASQLDILPTIAGLANITYTNTTLGTDLLHSQRNNQAAFIIDVDTRRIGVVHNDLFYSCNINGAQEKIGSLLNDEPTQVADSTKEKYRLMTNAFYETSKYLLLNNKKKNY